MIYIFKVLVLELIKIIRNFYANTICHKRGKQILIDESRDRTIDSHLINQ
jgi:hypothetical protein